MRRPATYEQNIFINCPFDPAYTPLFNALVFTIHALGWRARCSLEADNAAAIRLGEIMNIIAQCRFSIHDISRTEIDPNTGLPRFNMPLELGVDLGCRRFGRAFQQEKVCLILDSDRYRYRNFISDIAGQDIRAHRNQPEEAIRQVRNWLTTHAVGKPLPGPAHLVRVYQDFQADLPRILAEIPMTAAEAEFVDYQWAIVEWLKRYRRTA
jgi:hypothetical protein